MSSPGTGKLGAQLTAIVTDTRDVSGERPPLAARFKYSLVIRRYEFLPVYLPLVLVPALLSANSWSGFGSLNTILAMVYVISGLQVANMTNALVDREQDAQLKSRQSDAVYGIGVSRVVVHIAISTLVCAALAVFLAARAQHWDMLLYALAAGLIGFAYSLPPLHLKSGGVWQLIALQTGCVFFPALFILRLHDHGPGWEGVVAVAGYAMALTSLFVTSHGEDYVVDGQFGIRTYVRAVGLVGAFRLQSAMLLVGSLLLVGAVLAGSGFSWGLVPFVAAWVVSQRFLYTVTRDVSRSSLDSAMEMLHRKSLIGPYHSAFISWAAAVLAVFLLAGW